MYLSEIIFKRDNIEREITDAQFKKKGKLSLCHSKIR